jgi:hypothetical protein
MPSCYKKHSHKSKCICEKSSDLCKHCKKRRKHHKKQSKKYHCHVENKCHDKVKRATLKDCHHVNFCMDRSRSCMNCICCCPCIVRPNAFFTNQATQQALQQQAQQAMMLREELQLEMIQMAQQQQQQQQQQQDQFDDFFDRDAPFFDADGDGVAELPFVPGEI